jgi:hypothetical protein
MPLYRKAIEYKSEDLEEMTFDDSFELLLIFRYLDFRDDPSLSKEFIKSSMEQLRIRLIELNPSASHFPGII